MVHDLMLDCRMANAPEPPKRRQFNIRHLLIATTLIAFALMVGTNFGLLLPAACFVFLLGPALAVVLFWDFLRVDPTKTIVATVAILVIALAIFLLAR